MKNRKILKMVAILSLCLLLIGLLPLQIKADDAGAACKSCIRGCANQAQSCWHDCDVLNDDCWYECTVDVIDCYAECDCGWGVQGY